MRSNDWLEEQRHFQRHDDLIREADHRRLIRQARGGQVRASRAPLFQWASLARIRCRLSTLFEHLTSRVRPAPQAVVPTDCP